MTERRVNTIERYDGAPDGRQYSSCYVMISHSTGNGWWEWKGM